MSYMIKHFKGKYRLKTEIDESIGEFARDEKGVFIDNDIYIDCGRTGRIYHYGGKMMSAWVGDLKGVSKTGTYNSIVEEYNDIIEKSGRIVGDGEGSFYFNVMHIETIAKAMKARTSGSKISPFSNKNLPKEKYNIPKEDIDRMKLATKRFVDNNQLYLITKAYKQFIIDKKINVDKYNLKPKEIVHKLGYYDEMIAYLESL